MNESVFKEILGEALKCGLAEYDNAPEHKFSLKHRHAMKRIFARYGRNEYKLRQKGFDEITRTESRMTIRSIRRTLLYVTVIIVFMSFLVGWISVFVSEKFSGTVYHDYTLLTALDVENCPQTIEYKYALASVPEGFEIADVDSNPFYAYTLYKNKLTGDSITLTQWVKTYFRTQVNTEHHQLEEITVNGKTGLFIDFSGDEYERSALILDNGDYILDIAGDLNKTDMLNLAKFNKI